jgi:hypothetical protein
MLYNTQWTHVPTGASGSSTINAKDCVPAGGSFQARAGEMFLPMQEYFAGMDCPLVNASLVNLKDISASVVDSIVPGPVVSGSAVAVAGEVVHAERGIEIKINKNKIVCFILIPFAL